MPVRPGGAIAHLVERLVCIQKVRGSIPLGSTNTPTRPACDCSMESILDKISSPSDIRALPKEELGKLADELRDYIHKTVEKVGGHLSSNLGSIELTVAIHHVYDTPHDKIIWDVGHQAYAHKVLTGRRDKLPTIRQHGGLSGFPVRAESEYDAFGTAHASTAISAAMGYAVAGEKAVAIVGDGAMSGGMAFEALNNAGTMKNLDLLVILNDNDMSISPAVGALRQNLARILASTVYDKVREGSSMVMPPTMRELVGKAEEHLRGMVMPGTIFEELGISYYGPINGHDLDALVQTLSKLRDRHGPRLLHVATVKGKGYAPAEEDPVKHHGVSAAKKAPQKVETEKPAKKTYSQLFGDWICHAAERDSRVRAITPAMREGSGLIEFERRFPERYFDCGIAEQHSVTFAAGLACAGLKPVLAIYSTFLQRGYDQLIHDVAIQNLPVVFAIDRAGLVGADGATHHGAFDLTYLRCIPNLTVMAPSDEAECWMMLNTALGTNGPVAIRYPRGEGPGENLPGDKEATLETGKGKIKRKGKDVAFLAFGAMVGPAMEAAGKIDATVADMRFAKPIDTGLVDNLAKEHGLLVTVEENVVAGGGGSAILEHLATQKNAVSTLCLGLPDRFLEHGNPTELKDEAGLSAAGILASTTERLKKPN